MIRVLTAIVSLSVILSLSGCSGETNIRTEIITKDSSQERLLRSVDAFNNRPIYRYLTEAVIDSTPDNTLLQVVFDNLSTKLPAGYKKENETVMSWNESRQAIYIIWQLEAEVNNGGFNQFYFNPSGQFYRHLPNALKIIGAYKFADLTKKANETFEKEKPKITHDQDGTLEGFSKSYDDNPLNKLDDQFFALYKTENLQQLQIAFIRKHKSEFVD